jgi:hypothetical protein
MAIIRRMRSAADAAGAWTEPEIAPRTKPPSILTTVLVFFAVAVMLGLCAMSLSEGLLAWDVRFAYLPAAEAVLDGVSPYPELDDPILDEQKGYVYPPQIVLALVPLSWLPVWVVSILFAALLVALLGATLYVLDVRDVRCYAAAALWVPSISAVLLGNVSIPLAFALALLWRYRGTVWPSGLALGLSVSAKLVLWPVLVWTLATRRFAATLVAVAVGVAVTLTAWAVIGFAGLSGYPDLVRELSNIQAENSYSLVGMAATAGLGAGVGQALALFVGIALLVGCMLFARRGDDQRSFTCAVVATLAVSPIAWLHYLVVLLVPTAIARPRLSAIWFLPILLWISPRPGYADGPATFAPGIVVAVIAVVLLARPRVAPPAVAFASSA